MLFYGYYTNAVITMCTGTSQSSGQDRPVCESEVVPYSIPAAYFFTTTITFFVICMVLVYR